MLKTSGKIASIFSSIVDVLGRPGQASSLTSSRPSLNRLYHNWTCVLLIVDSPNVTVNVTNVLAYFISFFTQNLIHFTLWSIFSHFFGVRTKTRLNFLSVKNKLTLQNGGYCQHICITDMCTNITEKKMQKSSAYVTHEIIWTPLVYNFFFF